MSPLLDVLTLARSDAAALLAERDSLLAERSRRIDEVNRYRDEIANLRHEASETCAVCKARREMHAAGVTTGYSRPRRTA